MKKVITRVRARFGRAHDLPEVALIDHEAFGDPWGIDKHRSLYSSDATYQLATPAKRDAGPAGFIAWKDTMVVTGGKAVTRRRIVRLAVLPQYRRKKYGSFLIHQAFACPVVQPPNRVARHTHLVDVVLPDGLLPAAHALFAGCGFRSHSLGGGVARMFYPVLDSVEGADEVQF